MLSKQKKEEVTVNQDPDEKSKSETKTANYKEIKPNIIINENKRQLTDSDPENEFVPLNIFKTTYDAADSSSSSTPIDLNLSNESPTKQFYNTNRDGETDNVSDILYKCDEMILRQRKRWSINDSDLFDLNSLIDPLEDISEDDFEEGPGCPLPSTPDDTIMNDTAMNELLMGGELSDEIDLSELAHNAAGQTEVFVRRVLSAGWNCCHFKHLPTWLQDNDFLHTGHRPPLPSFKECFRSIFRIHTETVNIWTHLLGCIIFIGIALYFWTRPIDEIQLQEKFIFGAFFVGAIICLGCSFAYHTLNCHSEQIGKLFSKLDYCGIAILIMGSFVPLLHYGFYCHNQIKLMYLIVLSTLGVLSVAASLFDRFSEPSLRPLRAAVFVSFGLSGVIPAFHYGLMEGYINSISQISLPWLLTMGILYFLGALFYALRVPERWFPGKFDLWFQSHQIFHVFVIVAALVHYHGITEMAIYRIQIGECPAVTS